MGLICLVVYNSWIDWIDFFIFFIFYITANNNYELNFFYYLNTKTWGYLILLMFPPFEFCRILENFLVIWLLMQNQVMQNQLRQRTSLGTKFGPYSKTAIVQQVKNSMVIICFPFFPIKTLIRHMISSNY